MSKFKKLRPSQIEIDPRFNRDLDEPRAKAMARNIEADLLGVPVISERLDGKYVALDGQHRMTACRMASHDDLVLCEVHDGLSLAEEAVLFLRLNGGRRAVGVYDKFKAQLVAKDPTALEILSMLKAAGLRISKAPGRCSICAIQTLVGVYHRRNLPDVLSVLMAWSDGEAAYLEGTLIKALSLFLGKYPDVDLAEFGEKLGKFSAERVISKLKRMQGIAADISPAIAACSVFRDIYNERRRNKLPPPDAFQDAEPIAAE